MFIATLFASLVLANAPIKGQSKIIPWGGWWWPMVNGESALGWDDGAGRKEWKVSEVKKFNKCLALESSDSCEKFLKEATAKNGIALSPLMKFDLYVSRILEEMDDVETTDYTQSATHELNIHYIARGDTDHPHYEFKDFAGKCIGWSLSTMENAEPTKSKTLRGIIFKPADLKAILAVAYTGAVSFIPNKNFIGETYLEGSADRAYNDVYPHQLLETLADVIGKKKKTIVADLKPDASVWNYPIFAYNVQLGEVKGTKVIGSVDIKYISDQVDLDDVFSLTPLEKREDIMETTYEFELTVPKNWSEDFSDIKKSEWINDSVDDHPDTLITGLEDDWMDTMYEDYVFSEGDFEDAEEGDMALEANTDLFKRSSSDEFNYLEDLLKSYY